MRCAAPWKSSAAWPKSNADVSEDRRIEFRIGINVGDIIIDQGDIYGDGVNIAARIEAIAEPGGISISEDAWRQVQGKVAANFIDTGEQSLKNIPRPMRVYQVDISEAPTASPRASNLSAPDKPSIAVLPFQNMSGDSEQDEEFPRWPGRRHSNNIVQTCWPAGYRAQFQLCL